MKHFTIKELSASPTAVARGIDNNPTEQVIAALTRLTDNVLDPLRQAYGFPIYVNSGYRCPALNRAVGGTSGSQHLRGEAADITTGCSENNARLYRLLRKLELPIDQAINEHDFAWIHVSHRATNNRNQFFSIN